MLTLILLVFAFVLFLVAAALNPSYEPWRAKLGLIGLACWVLSEILSRAPGGALGR